MSVEDGVRFVVIPFCGYTLDLSRMKSIFIKTKNEPYVRTYVERRSDKYLTRILKLSMNLGKGNTRTFIFHFNFFLTDYMLAYTTKRYIHFLLLSTYFGFFIFLFNRLIICSTQLLQVSKLETLSSTRYE